MGTIKVNNWNIQGQLSVFVYLDTDYPKKNMWIAYCPELDLVGYGMGKETAKESLEIVLSDYFDYTLEHNALEEDLLSHGWRKYKDGKIAEPTYKELLRRGKLNSVISQQSYSKYSIPIEA